MDTNVINRPVTTPLGTLVGQQKGGPLKAGIKMQVKPIPDSFGFDQTQLEVSVDFYVEEGFDFCVDVLIVRIIAFLIPQSKVGVQFRFDLMRRLYKFKDGQKVRFDVPSRKIIFERLQGEVDLPDALGIDELVLVFFDQNAIGGQVDLGVVLLTNLQNL